MLPIFTKPLHGVTGEDAQQLISEQVPEGATVEFKEALPQKKGGADPWITKGQVPEYARNEILAELVAFANAHGGHLRLTEDRVLRFMDQQRALCDPRGLCADDLRSSAPASSHERGAYGAHPIS